MGLGRCSSTERRVRPRSVVEIDPPSDTRPGRRAGLEGVQIDALVFQGPP